MVSGGRFVAVRIEEFRSSTDGGVATFIATVRREDRQREPVDVFFAVAEEDASFQRVKQGVGYQVRGLTSQGLLLEWY